MYLVPPSGGWRGWDTSLPRTSLLVHSLITGTYTLSLLGVSPEIIVRYGLLDLKQSINLTTGTGTLSHHGYTLSSRVHSDSTAPRGTPHSVSVDKSCPHLNRAHAPSKGRHWVLVHPGCTESGKPHRGREIVRDDRERTRLAHAVTHYMRASHYYNRR